QSEDPLMVYSGKGLKRAVDDVVKSYEHKYQIPVSVVYAGSNTLLTTIQETHVGDIFIAGSKPYIKKLDNLVKHSQYLVKHVPVFIVRKNNFKNIKTYDDLLNEKVSIAIGNKDMAAVGRVAEAIAEISKKSADFSQNITTQATTVNVLLELVNTSKVDAAIVWEDMLTWKTSDNLEIIRIPNQINQVKEVWVATLNTTNDLERSKHFFDYIKSDGIKFFEKHGFIQ
ncbi:MAG: molybdate ABC transporter substrate-binding protein, partial [Gammaproteobacteria bacterium]|nr:molybdate ABC transporter substrate-binding protein [Gammaproteobacteria bacterium]